VGKKPRDRPKHLAAKLLAIRHKLGVSQSQLTKLLDFDQGSARISAYENGVREPDLLLLFRYAQLARVKMDVLINDKVELKFPKNWKPPKREDLEDISHGN
jgi:transcriptional regulator with XRE-family HTH domain